MLSHSEGLAVAAQASVEHATKLVELVCSAETESEIAMTIKRVDTISDILCSVLDTAEFIRNVHPSEDYVDIANKVSISLHSFFSQLNTHVGLYQVSVILSIDQEGPSKSFCN